MPRSLGIVQDPELFGAWDFRRDPDELFRIQDKDHSTK
jgi:hypothetical protein